jgi:heme exporter protein C
MPHPVARTLKVFSAARTEAILGLGAVALCVAAVVDALVIAPPDARQGNVQRLLYVHVPAAWLAYLSFAVVFVASIAYLWKRRTYWDRLALAAAEVGVLFTALTIVLGSLWGKPVWGVWWTWDPRLTTTAIMLLIYVGYLAVRRLPDDPARRARWAAVVGIVGFADIPVVHMSVTWWRSLHQPPSVLRPGAPTMATPMLVALLLGVLAFTVLFLYLLTLRLRVARLEERLALEAVSGVWGDDAARDRPERAPGLGAVGGVEETGDVAPPDISLLAREARRA